MPPKLVIDIARRRGLQGIAITDHDTVGGALAALDANRYSDFFIIPGVEVKTDCGDLIGLYIHQEIRTRRFSDVIEEIHDRGGIAYLPHPIRTFGAERTETIHATHPGIDLWEIYNGRYSASEFHQSRAVFERLSITGALCGSDAHVPWDIGVFRTELPGVPSNPQELLELSRHATLRAKPRSEIALSATITLGAMTKSVKKGEYAKVGRRLASLPWKAAKTSARLISRRAGLGRP